MNRDQDTKSWTLLTTAIDSIDQGVLVYDEDLTVVAFNRRALDLLEMPHDRFSVGGSFEDWVLYTAESPSGDFMEDYRVFGA